MCLLRREDLFPIRFAREARRVGFGRPFGKQMEKCRASVECGGKGMRAEAGFAVALETFGDSSGQDF